MGLLEQIGLAFHDVPYPGDEALAGCPCEECRWGVSRFMGKDWRVLHFKDAVSDQGDANIALLSPGAFRYFLPGLMGLALKSHVDSFWIAMAILDRLATSDRRTDSLSAVQAAIDQFSPEQREVVARFIERIHNVENMAPVIVSSAYENVASGIAKPYSQRELEDWALPRPDAGPQSP